MFYTVERFRPTDRIVIFVHGPEAEAVVDELGCSLWWDLPCDALTGSGQFNAAIYYAPEAGKAEQAAYHDSLARQNFTIHPHAFRMNPQDEAESLRTHDIEFVLHAFQTALLRADVVFVLGHTPRWVPLVRALQAHGKRVFVVTTRNLLSGDLFHAADKPIFYLEHFEGIERRT